MPKLKDKRREEFCQRYIIKFCGKDSAIGAGFSPKTAIVQASQLLARPVIQKRIAELLKDRSERTRITQDMVVRELAITAFSNFNDFAEYTKKDGLVVEETKKINIRKPEATHAIKSMKQVDTKDGGSMSITLHEKCKPLELLGKHLGMFAERVTLTGEEGGPIQIEYVLPRDKKSKDGEEKDNKK